MMLAVLSKLKIKIIFVDVYNINYVILSFVVKRILTKKDLQFQVQQILHLLRHKMYPNWYSYRIGKLQLIRLKSLILICSYIRFNFCGFENLPTIVRTVRGSIWSNRNSVSSRFSNRNSPTSFGDWRKVEPIKSLPLLTNPGKLIFVVKYYLIEELESSFESFPFVRKCSLNNKHPQQSKLSH